MPMNSLPLWLQYTQALAQALAVPIIGSLIAATGAWIALQQMRIAHTKLRHDLFDRKFTVFEAARKMLYDVIVSNDTSDEAIRIYLLETANAPFLLDRAVVAYLQEIGRRVSTVQVINSTIKSTFDDAKKPEMERTLAENLA